MSRTSIILAVSVAYLAVCLVVGLIPGRRGGDTADAYVAGDRGLGLILLYFIMGGTVFSSFAFLGLPGRAYTKGIAATYVLGYGTLSFVPLYFLGPRVARLGRHFGYVTQAEMVMGRFNSRALAGWMAVISTVAFVPYLALQVKGSGYVIDVVSDGQIPEWLAGAVVYGVVVVYVLRSGVLGVGWTNTFQGLFMMVMAWVLGLYLPYHLYGGVGPMFDRIAEVRPDLLVAPGLTGSGAVWGWGEYSSAVLVSAVGAFAWPHFFMKSFTARDDRTLQRTALLFPTFQIFLIPLVLIGFCGVLFASAPDQPDQILPHMLVHLDLPALVVGLFCAGALAASMSSGDSMLHAAASILARDGAVALTGRRLSARREMVAIRVGVVAVMVLAYGLAVIYQGSLVELLLWAYGPVVQFAPVLVATLYWRRARGSAVLAGLVVGSCVNLVLVLQPDWRPIAVHAGLYGLVVNVSILVAGSLVQEGPSDETFLEVASGGPAA